MQAFFGLAAVCGAAQASPTSPPAAGASVLMRALAAATPGTTITLPPGVYSGVAIKGFASGPVRITGQANATAPRFTDLSVSASKGLTFSGLEFDVSGAKIGPFGPENTIPFQVSGSTDIHFDHVQFHGSPRGTLVDTVSGALLRSSSNVSFTDSDFSFMHNALQHLDDTQLLIARNKFHHLWDDAIRGGGSSSVTLDSNYCYSNHPDFDDSDHPDCIQFWTSNTTAGVSNITITNNRYDRGTGTATQFIFLGNELNLPYQNVTIAGNVAYGSLWNGIAILLGRKIVIKNNTLTSSCEKEYNQVLISRIVTGNISGLTIQNNNVGAILTRGGDTDVFRSGDKIIPCQ